MPCLRYFLLGTLVAGCLLLTNCRTAETSSPLASLDYPALDGLEKEAAESLQQKQEALTKCLATTEPPPLETAKAYGELGVLYFAFGFHNQAGICFKNARTLEPSNHAWHYYFGILPNAEAAEKVTALEQAAKLQPSHSRTFSGLGLLYLDSNQADAAYTNFQKAIQLDPLDPVAHYQLGLKALADSNLEVAIEHFKKTLEADPRASATHYQLALALQRKGDTEAAETQMALRGDRMPFVADPLMAAVIVPSALAHYRLAENLRLNDKNQDAVSHYDQTVDLLPKALGPRVGRVLNLIQINQHKEALLRFRDDLNFFPNNSVLLHLLARLLAASPDESVRDGQKSLQLMHILGKGQVNPEMVETLAMAFAEVGKFQEAIEFQERALSVTDPKEDPEFHARLSQNLANYNAKKACREPWPKADPLFRLNTYLAMQLFPTEETEPGSKATPE